MGFHAAGFHLGQCFRQRPLGWRAPATPEKSDHPRCCSCCFKLGDIIVGMRRGAPDRRVDGKTGQRLAPSAGDDLGRRARGGRFRSSEHPLPGLGPWACRDQISIRTSCHRKGDHLLAEKLRGKQRYRCGHARSAGSDHRPGSCRCWRSFETAHGYHRRASTCHRHGTALHKEAATARNMSPKPCLRGDSGDMPSKRSALRASTTDALSILLRMSALPGNRRRRFHTVKCR